MTDNEKIICPACRKPNLATDAADNPEPPFLCPRCGCDLTPLATLTRAAAAARRLAATELSRGRGQAALQAADRSWKLRQSPESARLAWLAALLAGDFASATVWYRRT